MEAGWSAAEKENQARHEQVRKGRLVIRRGRWCRQVVKSSMYANFWIFRARARARVPSLSFLCDRDVFSGVERKKMSAGIRLENISCEASPLYNPTSREGVPVSCSMHALFVSSSLSLARSLSLSPCVQVRLSARVSGLQQSIGSGHWVSQKYRDGTRGGPPHSETVELLLEWRPDRWWRLSLWPAEEP